MAADLFEAFQSEAQGVAAMGQQMRRLLAPTELIRALRGRGPRVEPYLTQLGIRKERTAAVTERGLSGSSASAAPFLAINMSVGFGARRRGHKGARPGQ